MPWCGPSQRAAPVFDEAAAAHPDVTFLYHDNTDKSLPITMFPTVIGYNSKEKARTEWNERDFGRELEKAIEFARH
jgi:thiol-disulfide isomerase/thioredoxin